MTGAGIVLVLAARRAFEELVGPVPERLVGRFRFVKHWRSARIRALLPQARLVISKSYNQPAANRWIFAARRAGIATLLLADGPLEWSNVHANPHLGRCMGHLPIALMDPVIHDAVAAIGPAQSRWIADRNDGRGVRLMTYANRRIQTAGVLAAPDSTGPTEPTVDFLVTTAKTPCFGAAERRELGSALARCCEALEAGGHRYALRIFDRGLAAALPRERIDTRGSFSEALARTRCVIGTPSSVLLEAMQHGKPTATLLFRDSPLFYSTGWLLGGTRDWTATLRSMLAADPRRMLHQRFSLRENLSEEDFFDCCERLLERAEEIRRPLDGEDLAVENQLLHRLLAGLGRLVTLFARPGAERDD